MLVSVASILLGLSLLTTTSLASPAILPQPESSHVNEKRQNAYIPVTGIKSGGVQPRLEVRQLYNTKPNQWNLYLLAMQRFKNQPQDNLKSYYQIAGIHGVPNIPWDGVSQNPNSKSAVGYCTHSSVLFPGWHRPYLALFEQTFFDNVQAIVQSFPAGPQRDAYAGAAETIRIPFWDWAAAPASGLPTFPLIISGKYANVNTPTGQQTILNPLFRYDFHPLNANEMLYQPWSQWPVTLRWPTNNGSSTTPASSQNNLAQDALENSRINRRDSLYNMFTLCSDYLEFSNDAATSSSQGCHTSLENLHNQIHSLTGGSNNGHMTWLWWGAFDPVFFLHHANVDRLFAMWQAIYPNSYGASQVAPGNTYTIAQGSTQNADSPLTPFHANSNGAFWTTNSVRDLTVFGYTYPELQNGGSSQDVMGTVNSLYGPNASGIAGSVKTRRDLIGDLGDTAGSVTDGIGDGLSQILASKNTEYIANVAFPRWALDGSYTIYLFMGEPTKEDANSYQFVNNLIGSVNVFANPGMSANKLISTGSVPLTRSLASQIGGKLLGSLESVLVIPFLQKALQWRIATSEGRIVNSDTLEGFEVSVVNADFTPAASDDAFPIFKSFRTLPDITDGKAGGLKIGVTAACDRHS